MKKLFLILTLLLSFTLNAYANEPVIVKVKGMVCDFCAQSVMKVFQRETGLNTDNINISLDTQEITLNIPDDLEITNQQIERFIYYAGYDLVEIKRSQSGSQDHSLNQ